MIGIYASHASYPPKDGGSIRSWELGRLLSGRVSHEFIGREGVWTDSLTNRIAIRAPEGGKALGGLRTLLHRSHYVLERHIGRQAKAYMSLRASAYETIYANFVWSLSLPGASRIAYLDTHNSEAQWFGNLAGQSRSPLIKAVCRRSLNFSLNLLRKAPTGLCFIHVSEEDASWYREQCPLYRHVIVPNGCRLKLRLSPPMRQNKRKAYFLGSLSITMNIEAVNCLARIFWPKLRNSMEITIVGSKPPPAVRRLCAEHGWRLVADPTDDELDVLLDDQEIALLPFERSAGSKLKFYDALARGMIVMATSSVASGMGQLPSTVFVSDTAEEWEKTCQSLPDVGLESIRQSQNYARQYTWERNYTSFLENDPGLLGQFWRTKQAIK